MAFTKYSLFSHEQPRIKSVTASGTSSGKWSYPKRLHIKNHLSWDEWKRVIRDGKTGVSAVLASDLTVSGAHSFSEYVSNRTCLSVPWIPQLARCRQRQQELVRVYTFL